MYAHEGVGLAANQVGKLQRILVVDIDPKNERINHPATEQQLAAMGFFTPLVMINPRIVRQTGKTAYQEGCLSVPGTYMEVPRYREITVEAQDRNGNFYRVEARDFFAVAIQHEIDHLNGKVFLAYR